MGTSAVHLHKLDAVQKAAERLCQISFQPLSSRRKASAIGLLCKLLDKTMGLFLKDVCASTKSSIEMETSSNQTTQVHHVVLDPRHPHRALQAAVQIYPGNPIRVLQQKLLVHWTGTYNLTFQICFNIFCLSDNFRNVVRYCSYDSPGSWACLLKQYLSNGTLFLGSQYAVNFPSTGTIFASSPSSAQPVKVANTSRASSPITVSKVAT